MNADWRRLSREAGFRVEDDAIEVVFGDRRRQRVHVAEAGDETLRLWSIVAKPSELTRLRTPLVDAWRRNRLSELVGFTIDARGRMIGESWIPATGLTASEWEFLVHNIARACDRFEYLVTGADGY